MKQVLKDKIINIDTNLFDNKFLFDVMTEIVSDDVEIIYMSDLLEKRKNEEILQRVKEKPAMYSNVYSPKNELEIFTELFEDAIENKKRIHIVGVSLKEEIEMLEKYYGELGFFRDETNTFDPDFSIPYITVSVKIENLMWRGSDYKRMREKIFFNPPIRESGQIKAMFKGINRGVISSIYFQNVNEEIKKFLGDCVREEKILPITLAKTLKFNYNQNLIKGKEENLVVEY